MHIARARTRGRSIFAYFVLYDTWLAQDESVIKCLSFSTERAYSKIHKIIAVIEHVQMNINT